MKRPWTLGIAFLLLLGLWAVSERPRLGALLPPETAEAAASDNTFKRVWSVPMPGYCSASLSSDGQYLAVVAGPAQDKLHTKLSLWKWATHPAAPLWTRPQPGASQAAVSRGGNYVLSWAALDPTRPLVCLRRGSDGARVLLQTLDGAVWNTQVSPDGQYAAISTGAHSLYLVTLDDAPRLHRWPLPGLGGTLSFAPDNVSLTTATWDTSGVSCFSLHGASLWQFPAAETMRNAFASRIFETQASPGGNTVLGVSYANVGRGDIDLYLWHTEGNGAPVWRYELGADAARPHAALSADGRYVAVSYIREITRGEETIAEHRLALLDTRRNTLLWEQGNLLFSPQLVALSPDGDRITLSDGQHSLYNLNGQGRMTASYTLHGAGTIRQITPSPDGRYVLIYTSDSMLSLLQVGN